MEHMAWKGRIKEGCKEEYVRRHKEIWPEMVEVLKEAGICISSNRRDLYVKGAFMNNIHIKSITAITDESQETYREKLEKLAATGANMIYTPYEITTVADGWHSGGGRTSCRL